MGMLDQTTDTEQKPYVFASGGIDNYMKELKQPKQAQEIDETEGLDELNDMQPEQEVEPLEKLKASNAFATSSASLLTIALDSTFSTLLGMYSGDEPENYKADEDQRDELQKAIAEYIKLKGADIPPGFALVIIILSIYGTKGAMAFQFKKLKKENEAKDKEIETLKLKLEEFLNKKPD
jgi:hypothetical protein